jgi:hypothetical protein
MKCPNWSQASAEHHRAVSAWEARRDTAKEETGYNRANELAGQVNNRLSDAVMAMCDTPAMTMEGVRCKARAAAKVERGNADSDLLWSIVDNLRGDTA